ncbi:hypothetical protein PIB30_068257 [Stylosanthes scabra]|uniref:Uncharacterized protein n=1 Tax=Stylosanthes scabra TaxID=79078 RepID=A0ABU6WML2_9FABA|nr:hypothetical protein [Stylosanthes scabra]
MAKERVVTSSTSSEDSVATDRTQPSPSRVTSTSTPSNNPVSTPFQGNVSGWVGPNHSCLHPPICGYLLMWPAKALDQRGHYGYLNNLQPSFGAYGAGGTPPNFGTYNPPTMRGGPQSSSSNPVSSPALQPTQATMAPPQVVSTGNNRSIFPEMPRQMPTNSGPVNNTTESLAVFRQQIEESHHDLVNLLTQQMATMLTPMIENNNARIDQVAQQVNELAENFNPPPRQQMFNYRNPPSNLGQR